MINATLKKEDGSLNLSGQICFDNVTDIYHQGHHYINELQDIHVNLAQLTQSDSSGLALLIGWTRISRHQNKTIKFLNIPQNLQNMINICGLKEVSKSVWEN